MTHYHSSSQRWPIPTFEPKTPQDHQLITFIGSDVKLPAQVCFSTASNRYQCPNPQCKFVHFHNDEQAFLWLYGAQALYFSKAWFDEDPQTIVRKNEYIPFQAIQWKSFQYLSRSKNVPKGLEWIQKLINELVFPERMDSHEQRFNSFPRQQPRPQPRPDVSSVTLPPRNPHHQQKRAHRSRSRSRSRSRDRSPSPSPPRSTNQTTASSSNPLDC